MVVLRSDTGDTSAIVHGDEFARLAQEAAAADN